MFCYASILFPITHVTAINIICGLERMTLDVTLENAVHGHANSAINLDARLRILIPSMRPVNDRIVLRVVGDSHALCFRACFYALSAVRCRALVNNRVTLDGITPGIRDGCVNAGEMARCRFRLIPDTLTDV